MARLITLLSLCGLLLGDSGCSTVSQHPDQAAYRVIGSFGTATDTAIGVYMDYTKLHPAPPEQTAQMRRLVKAYVDAVEAARDAVITYTETYDQAQLDRALAVARASADHLITFITDITHPSKP